MDDDKVILHSRAKVVPTTADYDSLLALARSKAKDPDVFDSYEAVFWRAQVSNNRLDFYATSMAEQSLKNYVEDLKSGISFQDSHDWHKLGLGQSIDGELVNGVGKAEIVNQPVREVYGTFFTLAGLELGGIKTDNFIAAIRAGIWKDVSIGFYAKDVTCSICGKQSFHWWEEDGCTHLPGVEYEVGDGKRNKRIELAWASINDGRMMETSGVYDGATPEAEIHQVLVKANALAEQRKIGDRERLVIERRYQTRLREPKPVFAVGWDSDAQGRALNGIPAQTGGGVMGSKNQALNVDPEKLRAAIRENEPEQVENIDPASEDLLGDVTANDDAVTGETRDDEPNVQPAQADQQVDDVDVPEETVIEPIDDAATTVQVSANSETPAESVDVLAEERARLKGTGITLGKDPVKAVRSLADALIEARRQIADLREDAELGKQYRKDTIESALAEGVRAHGNAFKRDMWESMLTKASLDEVKAAKEAFAEEAERRLKETPLVTEADAAHGGQAPRRRKPGAHKVN